MRLIDADNLDCTNLPKKLYPHMQAILDFIDSQTTVEERKVGKWISDGHGHIVCTACNEVNVSLWKSKYCPCCGAEMRGSEND